MFSAFAITFTLGLLIFMVVDSVRSIRQANKMHEELMKDLERRHKEELKFYEQLRSGLPSQKVEKKKPETKEDLRKYLENHL